MAQRTRKARSRRSARSQKQVLMVFERWNYILLGVGVGLIALGFAIMRLDNQVDGFLSLFVSPLILIVGYGQVIYAILWRPRGGEGKQELSEPQEI